MKTKSMIKLINSMASIMEDHDLISIDPEAARLVRAAYKLNDTIEKSPEEFDTFIEAIRQANTHALSV